MVAGGLVVVVFVSLSLAHLFVVSCVSVCWEGLPLASPFYVYSLYLFPSYNGMTCSSLALFEKKEYLIMFHSQYCKSCYSFYALNVDAVYLQSSI